MNLSFYTAAVGAAQQQQRMNVQGNNIANVNTQGYKGQHASFASLMYRDIEGIDNERLPTGTGARMVSTTVDFGAGPVVDTGRTEDYAIFGKGFFALYEPGTGEVSYTRDGAFTRAEFQRPDQDGMMEMVYMLSDGEGRFVLNREGGMIEMTGRDVSQDVAVFDFVNTDGMRHVDGNRYVPIGKNGQIRFGDGEARQGVLEGSNVDLATELTKVIEAQRSYSYALKMVQTSDEIENTINSLRG